MAFDAAAVNNASGAPSGPFPSEVNKRLAEEREAETDPDAVAQMRSKVAASVAADVKALDPDIPANTLRAYTGDWTDFAWWCALRGHDAMQASPAEIATYLAFLSQLTHADSDGDGTSFTHTAKTITRRLTSIDAVYKAHGRDKPRHLPIVRETMDTIRAHREGKDAARQQVQTVDLAGVTALLQARPAPGWPDTVTRRRVKWVLSAGYSSGLERAKLAGLRVGDVVPDHDADTGKPILRVLLEPGESEAARPQVALVRSKSALVCPLCAYVGWVEVLEANQSGGFDEVKAWLSERNDKDELALDTRHHCDALSGRTVTLDAELPLCPRVWSSGKIGDRPMSGEAVRDIIKAYAGRAGEDPNLYSGGSLVSTPSQRTPARTAMSNPQEWVRSASLGLHVALSRPRDQL